MNKDVIVFKLKQVHQEFNCTNELTNQPRSSNSQEVRIEPIPTWQTRGGEGRGVGGKQGGWQRWPADMAFCLSLYWSAPPTLFLLPSLSPPPLPLLPLTLLLTFFLLYLHLPSLPPVILDISLFFLHMVQIWRIPYFLPCSSTNFSPSFQYNSCLYWVYSMHDVFSIISFTVSPCGTLRYVVRLLFIHVAAVFPILPSLQLSFHLFFHPHSCLSVTSSILTALITTPSFPSAKSIIPPSLLLHRDPHTV